MQKRKVPERLNSGTLKGGDQSTAQGGAVKQ